MIVYITGWKDSYDFQVSLFSWSQPKLYQAPDPVPVPVPVPRTLYAFRPDHKNNQLQKTNCAT